MKFCLLCKFQELLVKLKHASFGITGGKGLFSPIYWDLKTKASKIPITDHMKAPLMNWLTLLYHLSATPPSVQLLLIK